MPLRGSLGQGLVVTDGVGNTIRHVDDAQGLQGLVGQVWGNEIFRPEQGPRELSPVSWDPDAYFYRGNLGVESSMPLLLLL